MIQHQFLQNMQARFTILLLVFTFLGFVVPDPEPAPKPAPNPQWGMGGYGGYNPWMEMMMMMMRPPKIATRTMKKE